MFIARLEPLTNMYDALHHFWERNRTQRKMALVTFWLYLLTLLVIELNRWGCIAAPLAQFVPTNHFYAINIAFTLILGLEVVGLIFSISCSLSRSLGKQLEILALILLRDAFKVLSSLPEPVNIHGDPMPIVHIATAGTTAMAIFICLGVYRRMRRHQGYITNPYERMGYVMSKKLLSLGLFCSFIGFGLYDVWCFIQYGKELHFFETIYSILIFSDIALVFIAQRYMPTFHAVFRNSGFVIATLLMRLSLSVGWPYDAAASIFAALYVLGLTIATNYFAPEEVKGKPSGRK